MPVNIGRKLRNYLITGTLTLIPLTITYLTLRYLFRSLDNLLMPLMVRLLTLFGADLPPESRLPGIGILATVILVFGVGVMTKNYVGRKTVELGEWALSKIPLVRSIYSASKQLVEAFSVPGSKVFRKVVLVEYPRKGVFSLGFITSDVVQTYYQGGEPLYSVIVPTTPTPLSGMLILVRREEIYPLSISVEEGMKMVVSGGIITPQLRIEATASKPTIQGS